MRITSQLDRAYRVAMTMKDVTQPTSELEGRLSELFIRAKLPSSPVIASQILSLIDDPNSTAQMFARVIQADPGLAARLMKMANTAQFAQRTEVTTIRRAVTVFGLRQLRVIVLGFELIRHVNLLGEVPFDMQTFWRQSVLRACMGRELARKIAPSVAEEAFLVGLLQECGVPILVQTLGPVYADFVQNADRSPAAAFEEERRNFPHTHVDAISAMASMWHLPAKIAEPLVRQHDPLAVTEEALDEEKLAAISYFVGSIGFGDDEVNLTTDPPLLTYASNQLDLSEDDVQSCLEATAKAYREVGAFFKEAISPDLDVVELLQEALRKLSEQAIQEIQTIQVERARVLQQQENLKKQLGQYRDRAARDPLTSLLNRGGLLSAMDLAVCRDNISLTVIFVDLDDFKRLNDCFGHQVGDGVLRAVARTLDDYAHEHGGLAARYGGEEFIVMIPGLDVESARQVTEEVVDRVYATRVHRFDLTGPVTCSLGTVWAEPDTGKAAGELIAAADHLMYEAKRKGKNQATFATVGGSSTKESDGVAESFSLAADQEASAVLDKLYAVARAHRETVNDQPMLPSENNRKEARQPTQTPCHVTAFVGSSPTSHHEPGLVHNYSASGLSLLAFHPIERGGSVELAISRDGRLLYVAGIVAFSRCIQDDVYEMGVQVSQRDWKPILTADSELNACTDVDWLSEILHPADAA